MNKKTIDLREKDVNSQPKEMVLNPLPYPIRKEDQKKIIDLKVF